MKRWLFAVIVCGVLFSIPSFTTAQDYTTVPTGNEPYTVYAVFFYMPTCPHCHDVIDNVLPLWHTEFGNQLVIVPVNASTQGTETLFANTCITFGISADRCGSVPLMIIGDRYMLGSVDIPEIGTELIRDGIANGGIPLPIFAGMQPYFSAFQNAVASSLAQQPEEVVSVETVINTPSLSDRLAADPIANAIAVVVLVALAISVVVIVVAGRQTWQIPARVQQVALMLAVGISLFIALSLVAGTSTDSLANLTAWVVLGLMSISAMLMLMTYFDINLLNINEERMIPFIALSGLVVAIYLTIVETTQIDAVCGTIGQCNAVQQSDYAYILGIPIGVLGIAGYTSILLAWGAWKFGKVQSASTLFLVITTLGALFSIYLTFLEPFVIGATCAWCLMSALTMLTLLWLIAPEGWKAFYDLMSRLSESSQTI